MESVISPEDVKAFQRDGAIHLKGVLQKDNLDLLVQGLEDVHARPSEKFSRTAAADGTGSTLVDQCPAQRSASLKRLLEHGTIPRVAAELMQVSSAHLILDQIFYKEPGRIVPTPWHQDTPFLCVRGQQMARVWLTCDPSPRNLTVQVVRGSHRWNVVYGTRSDAMSEVRMADEGGGFSYADVRNDMAPPTPDIERLRDSFEILSWDVAPGDAIVFHGNVLHGASGCDHHPSPRRAYATTWGGPDLRYHDTGGQTMPTSGPSAGTGLQSGSRIADFPQSFPVYWRGA